LKSTHSESNSPNQKEEPQNIAPRKALRYLGLVAAVCILSLILYGLWFFTGDVSNSKERRVYQLIIEPGSNLSKISRQLEEEGLINSAFRLMLIARISGLDTGIQLGKFPLNSEMSPFELLKSLQSYSVPVKSLRIPDGMSTFRVAGLMGRELGIDSAAFISHVFNETLSREFFPGLKNSEGLLFPDTYRISQDESEEDILNKMCGRFIEELKAICNGSIPDTLDVKYIVTLASIVQGEYQLATEADTIAAVYLNRLRIGMKLQADPTVQYILGEKPRRLLFSDLKIDSPYNTYMHHGLPPGPINSPGSVALKAAIYPAQCDYLYFVASGDGGHHFASTYKQHLKNRQPLDALRRKISKQK